MHAQTHKFNYYIASIISVFLLAMALNALYQAELYYARSAARIQLAVFVKNNSTVSLDVLKERLLNLDGVRDMSYFSPEKALEKALKETPAIKDVLVSGDNPFPAYFIIIPVSLYPRHVESLKDRISLMDGVDEVRYDANLVDITQKLRRSANFFSKASRALLAAAVLVILARLGWMIRSKKFNISKYAFTAVAGLLAGLAASALYYLIVGKFLPKAPFELMPLKYVFYLVPSGMLFTLIWDN
jgi:cell division protein FtsX